MGIVVVHRDLSMTCTQHPCAAMDGAAVFGSDRWVSTHVKFYACDFVLGPRCPRCVRHSRSLLVGNAIGRITPSSHRRKP
jgi:hypothetical protein